MGGFDVGQKFRPGTGKHELTSRMQHEKSLAMKMLPKTILLSAFLYTFALLSAASAQNLLQNGDFSQGTTGWTVGKVVGTPTPEKVCKVEVISDGTRKSGKAAHFSDTDDHAGIGLYQKVPASPETSYQLAYTSKTTSTNKGSPGYAMIQFLDTKGTWLNNPEAAGPQGTPTPEELKNIKRDAGPMAIAGKGWVDGVLVAKAPVGTAFVNIMFKASNSGAGEIDVSDVVLTKN